MLSRKAVLSVTGEKLVVCFVVVRLALIANEIGIDESWPVQIPAIRVGLWGGGQCRCNGNLSVHVMSRAARKGALSHISHGVTRKKGASPAK